MLAFPPAQPWFEHLWVWGCWRRAIAAIALQQPGAFRSGASDGRSLRCQHSLAAGRDPAVPGRLPGQRAGYLAGSCCNCIQVFPTTPNDLTCQGLNPHAAGCCTEPRFPKGFTD